MERESYTGKSFSAASRRPRWRSSARSRCVRRRKLSKSAIASSATDDVASTLQDAAYVRTATVYSATELGSFSHLAAVGKKGPATPGGTTWHGTLLATVTPDNLTAAELAFVRAKKAMAYTDVAGLGFLWDGFSSSGEYIDVTHGIDWMHARIQEGAVGAVASAANRNSKIPYTDEGAQIIVGVVLGVCAQGVANGFLASSPAPTCTVPKVANISPAVKATRLLPDVAFGGTLAGAIHGGTIKGVLSL